MSAHEREGFVAVGALLGIALVHRIHHHRHLLPGAAHRLLPLLGQFPWDKEFQLCGCSSVHADRRQSHGTGAHWCSGATAFILAMIYVPYTCEVPCQASQREEKHPLPLLTTVRAAAATTTTASHHNNDKPEKTESAFHTTN